MNGREYMERRFGSCQELSENYTHCVEVTIVPQNVGLTLMKSMPRAAFKRNVSADNAAERMLMYTYSKRQLQIGCCLYMALCE